MSNPDIAVAGGIGFDIGKFFIDLHISGFPRTAAWNHISVNGSAYHSAPTTHNITCGGSIGLLF